MTLKVLISFTQKQLQRPIRNTLHYVKLRRHIAMFLAEFDYNGGTLCRIKFLLKILNQRFKYILRNVTLELKSLRVKHAMQLYPL